MTATWILVADSSRARLFKADKARAPLTEIEGFDHPDCRARTQDLISDRQGRGSGYGPHFDSSVEPKRQAAITFAKTLTSHLKNGRCKGLYDRLYIAASPGFLGLLREKLDTPTAQMVAGAISKDLTQLDAGTIRGHLPYCL